MPYSRIPAPTNANHTVWVSGASAITGSPTAATKGHHDPAGTCTGSGADVGCGCLSHSWSRLVTVIAVYRWAYEPFEV